MSTDKSYPSLDIETGRSDLQKHNTGQPVREKQWAKDVVAHITAQLIGADAAEAGSTKDTINATGHSALKGDIISFTSGALDKCEYRVLSTGADTIETSEQMRVAPGAGDTFNILRQKQMQCDDEGNLITTSGPIQFRRDGVPQEVIEDTANPANNRPFPVKLASVTGDINITANDLNVSTSHVNDSMRLGDGTNLVSANASGELLTKDADAETALGNILTELQAKADLTETQPVSVASLPLPAGAATEVTLASVLAKIIAAPATEAKQDSLITELGLKLDESVYTGRTGEVSATPTANTVLGRLKDIDDAHSTLLTELQAKADLTETQPVSAASLPLPAGAATETTLDNVLTELQAKADLTETQPVSAASLPLPAGAATEATLSNADTTLTERLSGSLVPAKFDYIALTYVASGNGQGEIETATYKTGGSGGTTQATLTLAYDSENRISSVTKS